MFGTVCVRSCGELVARLRLDASVPPGALRRAQGAELLAKPAQGAELLVRPAQGAELLAEPVEARNSVRQVTG